MAEALDMAVRERGKPTSITQDNSNEFAGKVGMDAWPNAMGMTLALIRPGKATENAFIESFIGRPCSTNTTLEGLFLIESDFSDIDRAAPTVHGGG